MRNLCNTETNNCRRMPMKHTHTHKSLHTFELYTGMNAYMNQHTLLTHPCSLSHKGARRTQGTSHSHAQEAGP